MDHRARTDTSYLSFLSAFSFLSLFSVVVAALKCAMAGPSFVWIQVGVGCMLVALRLCRDSAGKQRFPGSGIPKNDRQDGPLALL